MPTKDLFELRVLIAAEQAKQAGFEQTYLALLDVLRASRCTEEGMIGNLQCNGNVPLSADMQPLYACVPSGLTKH